MSHRTAAADTVSPLALLAVSYVPMGLIRSLLLASAAANAAAALDVTAFRPDAAAWKRTQCGSPSGKHGSIPAVPAAPGGKPWTLEKGMDLTAGGCRSSQATQ